jgi:hypothetical protein
LKTKHNAAVELEGVVTALLMEKGNPCEENARAFTVPELKVAFEMEEGQGDVHQESRPCACFCQTNPLH